jgi:hypothetical protein
MKQLAALAVLHGNGNGRLFESVAAADLDPGAVGEWSHPLLVDASAF